MSDQIHNTEEVIEETVDQIKQIPDAVNDTDNWRVLVPVEYFDEVKERLDTEYDLGTYYEGMSLCYTDSFDVPRIEYKNDLAEHTND